VSGGATLGGATLDVGLTNGFIAVPNETFTILTAPGGLSGAFSNVPNGQRLFTMDGLGSFLVNYGSSSAFAATAGPNSLVLSNFAAVPEPSTWALLALGGLALAVSRLRRKS